MLFRLTYIIRDFEFGDINLSDLGKGIDVKITQRPKTDTHPPFEEGQGVALATCKRDIPTRHHDEAVSSGVLSIKKASVAKVHREMYDLITHAIRLARWRTASPKSGPNPIRWGVEFSWSVDGADWRPVADNLSLKVTLSVPPIWTAEEDEFVKREVLGSLDEPLGHELWREAMVNSKDNLRSSLVMAVVAAEVGFKQFASRAFPDTAWILETLPSPPLETMLKEFPWSSLGTRINNEAHSVPESVMNELKKAVTLRNKIVHGGTADLTNDTLESVLAAVRSLLYFLDAVSGQNWALQKSGLKQL